MMKRQFRIVNKGKGKLDITSANLHEVVGNTEDEVGGDLNLNTVESYRSSVEADGFIYSGFLLNSVIVIKRTKDNIEELAQNLTNLNVDWVNRLTLTYI